MESKDTDRVVLKAVLEHYREHDTPYYLAELGKLFRSENIDIPEGVRFKDYLKSRYHGSLVVVQDTDEPAKIAIAPPEKEQRVLQQLAGESSVTLGDSSIDHARLPFALIAAFCKVPLPGERVYFRIAKPFRYETWPQAPGSDYVEIAEQFRPLSLAGKSVHDLSYIEKQMIYEQIDKWADANSIDQRVLYYNSGKKAAVLTRQMGGAEENALQRLIDAQEPELRGRIRIPGDIASALMRLP